MTNQHIVNKALSHCNSLLLELQKLDIETDCINEIVDILENSINQPVDFVRSDNEH